MNWYYYISDNFDELEWFEVELEVSGIVIEQIYVFSEKDVKIGQCYLYEVFLFMKKDLVCFGCVGLLVGFVLVIVVVVFVYVSGWMEIVVGWILVIFFGVVFCVFCLWEGSFFGLQCINCVFCFFEECLYQGQYLFFVDVKNVQELILVNVVSYYLCLQDVGIGFVVFLLLLGWQ